MSANPRFSVVIPTRNRAALTRIAITSVLRQTYSDWELVVADNSQDEETGAVVAEFDDDRIRYVRSGDLSMCENWEFAVEHARGDYLCLLQYKQVLKYHALETLAELCHAEQPEVVRWTWDSISPLGFGYRVKVAGGTGASETVSPRVPLESFVSGSYTEAKGRLPIPQYSAIRRELLDRIRSGPVGVLFPPVSPDYTLSLQVCNYCESVTYLDQALVAFSDLSVSNGQSFRLKTALSRQFTAEMGGPALYYDQVPIKVGTVFGSVYNDYCKLRAQLGGRLEEFPPDWANYFLGCYESIHSSIALGVDMSVEVAEWERALAEQEPQVKERVAVATTKHRQKRVSLTRRLRKSRALTGFKHGVRSIVQGKILRHPQWRFDEILSYLDWESKQQR